MRDTTDIFLQGREFELHSSEKEDPLGFYNRSLPPGYILEELENERNCLLKEIKEGLISCYSGSDFLGLIKYIKLTHTYLDFKYSLPLEERIFFINLLYDIAGQKYFEISVQTKCIHLILRLIKKRYYLDLKVPWRPFYELLKHSLKNLQNYAIDQFPASVVLLVRKSAKFFPPSATDEILTELRPYLCPFDETIFSTAGLLVTFLPTNWRGLEGEKEPKWLREMFNIWLQMENIRGWDVMWMGLFSSLAQESCGRVDWNPYLPQFFTQFLRFFRLPVGTVSFRAPSADSLPNKCSIFFHQKKVFLFFSFAE